MNVSAVLLGMILKDIHYEGPEDKMYRCSAFPPLEKGTQPVLDVSETEGIIDSYLRPAIYRDPTPPALGAYSARSKDKRVRIYRNIAALRVNGCNYSDCRAGFALAS